MKAADVRALSVDQLNDELAKLKERAVQSAFPGRHRPARKRRRAFSKSAAHIRPSHQSDRPPW